MYIYNKNPQTLRHNLFLSKNYRAAAFQSARNCIDFLVKALSCPPFSHQPKKISYGRTTHTAPKSKATRVKKVARRAKKTRHQSKKTYFFGGKPAKSGGKKSAKKPIL